MGSLQDEAGIDGFLAESTSLFGTVDQIVAELQARHQRFGFSYFSIGEYFQEDAMERFAPVVARLAGT